MRRVWVVLENSVVRKAFLDRPQPEMLGELARWLAACEARVRDDGVCRSFTIGVHVDAADCGHETGVRNGNAD